MNIPFSWLAIGGAVVAALIISRGNWSNPILDQVAGFLRSTFGSLLNWSPAKPTEPAHCIDCLLHVQQHLSGDAEASQAIQLLVGKAMAKHATPTQ